MTRPPDVRAAIDAFMDVHRARYLWFLRGDWHPTSDEQRARVLDQIQQRADRATFVQAAELKRWLSPT